MGQREYEARGQCWSIIPNFHPSSTDNWPIFLPSLPLPSHFDG